MNIIKFRYKLIKKLIKILTPDLFKQIESLNLIIGYPRPSIKFLKEYFYHKSISGVEVGVYRGSNSLSILKTLNINSLYLIDCWQNYFSEGKEFKSSNNYSYVLNKFKDNDKVIILKGYSLDLVNKFQDNSLDFVYIDGNHEYNYIYNDLIQWSKKVKPKGVICGHDILKCKDILPALINYCHNTKRIFKIIPPDFYFIKTN